MIDDVGCALIAINYILDHQNVRTKIDSWFLMSSL
jgi:hypothetical protein